MDLAEMIAEQLINAVWPILIGIVVALLGLLYQWLKLRWEQMKIRLPQWQIMIIEQLARAAVSAAEQKFGPGAGEEKFTYALNQIGKWFEDRGVHIDREQIEMWIEDAVREMEP